MGKDNQELGPQSTDADESSLRKELQELRLTLQRLREELQCGVCRSTLTTPVSLPCGHAFCSECARRFLLTRSRCLEAHCATSATTAELRPVRALEAVVLALTGNSSTRSSSPKQPVRGRIAQLVNPNRNLLMSSLRSLGLRTEGTLEQLSKRHREFVLLWNVNLDTRNPQPENVIAARVINAERAAVSDAMRGSTRNITNLFRRRPAVCNSDSVINRDIPQEGDSFSALITKVRRRENRTQLSAQPVFQNEVPGVNADEVISHPSYVQNPPPRDLNPPPSVPNAQNLNISKHSEPIPHTSAVRNPPPRDLHLPSSEPNPQDVNNNHHPEPIVTINRNEFTTLEAPSSPQTQSPTSSDLMLIDAADCASETREVPNLIPSSLFLHAELHTAPHAERSESGDSQSTLAPSPTRPLIATNASRQHVRAQSDQITATTYDPVMNTTLSRASTLQAQEPKPAVVDSGATSPISRSQPRISQRYGAGNITIGPRFDAATKSTAHAVHSFTSPIAPHSREAKHESATYPHLARLTATESSARVVHSITPSRALRSREALHESAPQPRFTGCESRNGFSPMKAKTSMGGTAYRASAHGSAPAVTSPYQPRSSASVPSGQEQHRHPTLRPYVSNSVQPSVVQTSSPALLQLSEEQRIRIEQNRLRAIERQKAAKKRRLEQSRDPN